MNAYTQAYSRLERNSLDLYFISSMDGRLIQMNQSSQSVFGNKPWQNIKNYFYKISDWGNYLHRMEGREYISGFEIRLKKLDGSILTGLMHSCYYINDEELETWRVFLVKDISTYVKNTFNATKLNLQLLDLNNKLNDAYNAMNQQERLASIGQLSAGVAHEINNPLAFVSNNLLSL